MSPSSLRRISLSSCAWPGLFLVVLFFLFGNFASALPGVDWAPLPAPGTFPPGSAAAPGNLRKNYPPAFPFLKTRAVATGLTGWVP